MRLVPASQTHAAKQAAEQRDIASSARREVRNPLLALPSAKKMMALPPESKAALRALLLEMSADCRAKAEEAWRKSKAPMATYHRATGIYAGHLAKLLSPKAVPASGHEQAGGGLSDTVIQRVSRRSPVFGGLTMEWAHGRCAWARGNPPN